MPFRVAKLEEHTTKVESQMRELESEKRELQRRIDDADHRLHETERRLTESERAAEEAKTLQVAVENSIQSASDNVRIHEDSMEMIFATVSEQVKNLTGAERASLFLVDEKTSAHHLRPGKI